MILLYPPGVLVRRGHDRRRTRPRHGRALLVSADGAASARRTAGQRVITLEEAASRLVAIGPAIAERSPCRSPRRWAACWPTRTITAPWTCRPSPIRRWTGSRCVPRICPGRLRIIGEVAAGGGGAAQVAAGTAVRISTGAPIPPGADAVVPIERCDRIRRRGSGHRAGPRRAPTFARRATTSEGRRGGPSRAPVAGRRSGSWARSGWPRSTVRARPRIAIVSSGDELTDPGAPLAPGHIYDANAPALAAAVSEMGGEPLSSPGVGGRARGGGSRTPLREPRPRTSSSPPAGSASAATTTSATRSAASASSTSGGSRSSRASRWPSGGSTDRIVIGLPGNPVSALVVTELLVRPLRARHARPGRGRATARLGRPSTRTLRKDPERVAYLRVRVRRTDDGWAASPAGGQLSSQLRALADANGSARRPARGARWTGGACLRHHPHRRAGLRRRTDETHPSRRRRDRPHGGCRREADHGPPRRGRGDAPDAPRRPGHPPRRRRSRRARS